MNDANNTVLKTIEVICDGKQKRIMNRYKPESSLDDMEVGIVDMGKKNNGLWIGYAAKQEDGTYSFTKVMQWTGGDIANDNSGNDNGNKKEEK